MGQNVKYFIKLTLFNVMFKIKICLLFLFIKRYGIFMEFNCRHSKVNKLNN